MPRIGHDPALERARMQERVRDEGDRRLELVTRPYRPVERHTWDQQAREADAILADPEAPAILLPTLAEARGKDLVTFAGEIAAKRDEFAFAARSVLAAQERLIRMDPVPKNYADDEHWP